MGEQWTCAVCGTKNAGLQEWGSRCENCAIEREHSDLLHRTEEQSHRLTLIANALNHFNNGTERSEADKDAALEKIGAALGEPF